tara:strand:- start:123 stop:389 length:267 start_codon:yes stop_codon:yes gene_type:complete
MIQTDERRIQAFKAMGVLLVIFRKIDRSEMFVRFCFKNFSGQFLKVRLIQVKGGVNPQRFIQGIDHNAWGIGDLDYPITEQDLVKREN